MGPIRIITVVDGSSVSNRVNSYAHDIWFEVDHPNTENIYLLDVRAGVDNRSLAQQMKIQTFPSVVFAEVLPGGRTIRTITAIAGNSSKQQIKSIYLQILEGRFVPGTGKGGDSTPIIPGDDKEFKAGVGLGLFEMPRFGWPILAAFLTYKSLSSKSTYGRVGFGAGAAYCAYQHITHLDG